MLRLLPLLLLALLLLLQLPQQSKSVKGPTDKNARIAIVGAGPAGLHMAYMLRSLGFTKVRLLEESDRVGGRSVSLPDAGGIVHEMGACYLTSDYDIVRQFAKWAGHSLRQLTLPEASMWLPSGGEMHTSSFIVQRIRQHLRQPTVTPQNVAAAAADAARRYARIHSQMFASDGAEFPSMRPASLSQLNMSIKEFLTRNNLLALEPFFLIAMSTQGYGSLDNTSIVYGMMWMTPALINDVLTDRDKSNIGLLADGYEALWKDAYKKLQPDIRFNTKVVAVRRNIGGRVTVRQDDGIIDFYDWVVWTPDITSTSHVFKDLSNEEKQVFSKLKIRQFRTQLLDFPNGVPMKEPVTYFMQNLLSTHPNPRSVWAARNSAKALGKSKSSNSVVTYFLADEPNTAAVGWAGGIVRRDFTFRYMPHFSIQDMAAGAMWNILDLQGKKRSWFAGHSVVFDSVKSVLKYNKMLLSSAYPDQKDKIKAL